MNELTNPRRRPGFYLHVVPAALYIVAIFYGGLARNVPDIFFHETLIPPDKVLHFFAFGGMQMVLFRAFRFLKPGARTVRLLVWAVVAASVLGALLELVQATVPYRDAEFMDWVADTLGALVAMGVLWLGLRLGRGLGGGGRVSAAGPDRSE